MIYFKNLKIFYLLKNNLTYCSICSDKTNNCYIKLHLLHMHVAFLNFNGDLVETIKNSSKIEVN